MNHNQPNMSQPSRETDSQNAFSNPNFTNSQKKNILRLIRTAKSPLCGHRGACVAEQLRRTCKTVLVCWGMRFLLKLWATKSKLFRNPFQAIKLLLKFAFSKDAFSLALVMAPLTFIKGSICLQKNYWSRNTGLGYVGGADMHEIRKKISYFVPGLIFGCLTFYFVHEDYRNVIGLYTFSRALDLVWSSYKKRRGLETRSIEYGLLYMVMTTVVILSYCFDPDLMPESLYKLYVKFSSLTEEEVIQKNILTWKFGFHHYD